MINSVETYLSQLKKELNGCDRATVQDALSDAEEYLSNAIKNARETAPDVPEADALPPIIQEYGTPAEIAGAYKRLEPRLPSRADSTQRKGRSLFIRFFGIIADSRAWGSLFYLLFALATGIIYFTWAITGVSVSISLLVLIIGIPIAGIFLLSVRGIALIEGRLVEALLGTRMPRRPLFSDKTHGLWGRFKSLLADRYTWSALAYMIFQLPLGIFYFSLFVTLVSVSLYLIVRPIFELWLGIPVFNAGVPYYTPGWLMPFAVVGGILLLFLTMHLAKLMGKLHGTLAKAMLVKKN